MVTLDQLKEMAWKESICVAIDFAQKNYGNRPTRPSKPIMPKNPKAEQAFEFAKLLKEWEEEMEAYRKGKLDPREQQGVEVLKHGEQLVPWRRRAIALGATQIRFDSKRVAPPEGGVSGGATGQSRFR